MSEPVFVDASAWVAITNTKDRYYTEAMSAYRRQAFAFDRHFMEASQQYGFSLVRN